MDRYYWEWTYTGSRKAEVYDRRHSHSESIAEARNEFVAELLVRALNECSGHLLAAALNAR